MNTTVETGGKTAHGAWDGTEYAASTIAEGTKNLASAGVEKTEQAWQGIVTLIEIEILTN